MAAAVHVADPSTKEGMIMKKILLFLVLAAIGLPLMIPVQGCGKSPVAPEVANTTAPSDSVLTLIFDTPKTISELAQFSREHHLDILELRIKRAEYIAGFRLDGRDLTTASEFFASEHRKFLNLMLSRQEPEMAKLRSAAMAELSTLSAATIKAQAVTVQATSAMVKNLPGLTISAEPVSVDNVQPQDESRIVKPEPGRSSVNHPSQMWAPYGGSSEVTKSYSYQRFIFNNLDKLGSYFAAYEHETHLLDKNFANQTGYWSSNLPNAYLDCGNGSDSVDNFAVGSFTANQIRTYTWYYAYIGLTGAGQSVTWSPVTIWAQRGTRWTWNCGRVTSDEHAGPLASHTTWGGMSWQF